MTQCQSEKFVFIPVLLFLTERAVLFLPEAWQEHLMPWLAEWHLSTLEDRQREMVGASRRTWNISMWDGWALGSVGRAGQQLRSEISVETSHFSSLSSPNTGLAVHSISLYYIHSLQSTLYSLHTSYHTLTMLNMSHSYSNWRHKLHPHLRNVLSARLRDDICINKT